MTLRKPADIPTAAGCYLFRDADGRVIYVGKAKSLRERLASYFQDARALHPRTVAMLEQAADVEWIISASEVESLHLEYNLIKQHRPRYNVRYRDDKSYPSLAITVDEEVPRAMVTRGPRRKTIRTFGPYAHAYAIRETLDLLLRTFPMRTCTQGVFARAQRQGRACLLYDIGKCAGPCVGHVSVDGHRAIVDDLIDFMDGNHDPVLDRLDKGMHEASADLDFERAARLRDQIASVRRAIETQVVVSGRAENLDVVGLVEDDLEAAVQVFFVRGGRMVGRRGFVVDKVEDLEPAELIAGFLRDLYMDQEVPREILIPVEAADAAVLGALLAERRGGPVRLRIPQRGDKRALLASVTENADESFRRHKLKRRGDFAARARQLNALQAVLDLPVPPLRIECYDISNLGPTDVVASMVVFEDGLPKTSDYRRFAIRGVQGQDDFASMAEVIERRFSKYLEQRSAPKEKGNRFAYPPNLVVVDGGKGQVNAAVRAMESLGIVDIPTAGLAKRFEEVHLPGRDEPVRIPRGDDALYLLQHIRDEAHRFALRYQRTLRGKRSTASALDRVPGVGEARKKQLLRAFGSVRRILQASEDELAAVVPPSVARRVHLVLRGLDLGKE